MKDLNNLAYDFDLFAEKKEGAKVIDINEIKSRKEDPEVSKTSRNTKSSIGLLASNVRNFLFAAVVVAILCMGIYTRSEITEVQAEIENAKTEIAVLDSEKTRLEMEIEASLSVQNIEADAAAMGMQKQEKAQTSYIVLSDEDSAEVLTDEEEEGFVESLKAMLGIE